MNKLNISDLHERFSLSVHIKVADIEVAVTQTKHKCSGRTYVDCRMAMVDVDDKTSCKTFFVYLQHPGLDWKPNCYLVAT